jgi:hypothetical protein
MLDVERFGSLAVDDDYLVVFGQRIDAFQPCAVYILEIYVVFSGFRLWLGCGTVHGGFPSYSPELMWGCIG